MSIEAMPDYKLGSLKKEKVDNEVIDIFKMRFKSFKDEYFKIMNSVKEKEKKGRLDPHDKSYLAMTKEDWDLMAKDWKLFSKSRGFSEEDILEYEKWLIISGQKNNIIGAINDPWRRTGISVENLYLKHIEKALADGHSIEEGVENDYNEIKNRKENIIDFQNKDQNDYSDDNWS